MAAVEIDPIHSAAHLYNFPECVTLCADVTTLKGADIVQKVGRPIDVVVGGAPCQGFSLIGQRALDDPRNELISHFLRLVLELKPSYFVLENVKGLTLGKHKQFLDEIQVEFEKAGYRITLPWKVLNARDYGVPQDRQRLFLMGARAGLALPQYPSPQTPKVTCKDALDDLPDIEAYKSLATSDSVRFKPKSKLSAYAREMRRVDDSAWRYGYKRDWENSILTSSTRTVHSEISRRRFEETSPGKIEPISRFFKLAPDGVSNTLRAGTDSARGAFTSPRPIHYKYNRCISVREMARLHGFPDWFRFHSTKWHGARQIGNAVPPPLARAVAESIMIAMGVRPVRPKRILSLGGDELLNVDMKTAAARWKISVPIGKRDKKSGAKKRRQRDIEALRERDAVNA